MCATMSLRAAHDGFSTSTLFGLKGLPSLVSSPYSAAVSSGHVIFSETELAIVRTGGGVPVSMSFHFVCFLTPFSSGKRGIWFEHIFCCCLIIYLEIFSLALPVLREYVSLLLRVLALV